MKIKILLGLAMISLVLVGCDEKQYSVSYYKEHKEERIKKMEECHENVGGINRSPNCMNAQKANLSLQMGVK